MGIDMRSWVLGRFGLITLTISIFCLYILAFYFDLKIQNIPMFKSIEIRNRALRNGTATKYVLFWNTMFGNENFYFGEDDIFRDCPVNDCYATHDRNFANVADFDALLFHGNELSSQDLPEERGSRQWYVYVNLESPENRPLAGQFYEDYFNLTMTYRLDSDIPWSYAVVEEIANKRVVAPFSNTSWDIFANSTGGQDKEADDEPPLSGVIGSKRKAVSWFVSNCPAKSRRLEYVKELSRHIGVDIYGKCGDHRCPRSRDCFAELVEPDYFFSLSFENSLCQDYVTEKLYNALRHRVVPIVYGGANYSLFAPPYSYVNALDFDTPKDLADYLKKIIKSPREYQKYFRWKKYYKIESANRGTICKLCEFLHQNENETKIYTRLSDWYSRDKCPLQRLMGDQPYATRVTLKNRGW